MVLIAIVTVQLLETTKLLSLNVHVSLKICLHFILQSTHVHAQALFVMSNKHMMEHMMGCCRCHLTWCLMISSAQ